MPLITSRLPPETIETERLLMRLPLPGDGPAVNAAVVETFHQLHDWISWAQQLPTVNETEERVLQAHHSFMAHEDFAYFGFLKESGAFVVGTGIHPKDPGFQLFEIGYWCPASYQGCGYVTEAVKVLTQIGLDVMKAERIEIRCDPRNEPSRRVAELAGYELETTLINNARRPDGALRDTCIYVVGLNKTK